jgi:large subunit ribosomal protein L4
MLKVDLYDLEGKKSGQVELPKEIFGAKINKTLMAQAVRVYLSNQRRSLAKAKTRGEVDLTKAKWFRQKGTGHARHGAKSAPIFVGGGKAHGPTGEQNYSLKMSKKMKKKALFSALSAKLKEGKILVVKDLSKIEPKTKEMLKIMKNLKLKTKNDKEKLKILLILPESIDNVLRASRNIPGVNLTPVSLLNTYEVLNGGNLVFMKETIDKLKQIWI